MRTRRLLAIIAAILVIPAALWVTLAGLIGLIIEDETILIVTGALYLVMGLVALSGASCALWTRGYGMALLGPSALIIAGVWDNIQFGVGGTLAIVTILIGLAALILVRVARGIFRPLRVDLLPHGGMGTHGATAITSARVFSSIGAAMLAAVGVGLVFRGFDLYTMYQAPDVRFMSGQVFMIAGGVVLASGALALRRLMLPVALSGAFLALICVAWNIRLEEATFNDQWTVLAFSVSLTAYALLVLSWPVFGPKEVGQEVPAGAASWDLPELDGGGLSILRGSSQDVEGWAATSVAGASTWSSELDLPGDARIIEPPSEPQAPRPSDFIVEEVFVIYGDGRLICACGREAQGLEDADLMSGMLIAIQGLVQDGLKKGGDLDSITIGDNTVLLTKGEFIILASVVYGQVDANFREDLRSLVRRIEGAHAGVIEDWDGDASVLSEVTDMVMPLVVGTKHLDRDVVRQAGAASEVVLRSVTDFHRGYVRLSVVAWNGLPDAIRDLSVEVDYDPKQVRLETVAPSDVQRRGDRIVLGDLRPGEETTAAFLFDPQVPERATIDGSLTYLDVRGSRKRLEMRRQYADVVCPIFFTPENMNTAALRRLIDDRLHSTDLRMFNYPPGLPPQEVLRIGKMALGASGIQLVKEYVVEDHPYQAEVWYYGQTRDEGHPTVARLGVLEANRMLELYSASTVLEPVVGLQAEFSKELERVYTVRHAGMAGMQRSMDQGTRDELERRDLMIDRGA